MTTPPRKPRLQLVPDPDWRLLDGDALRLLPTLEDGSIASVVTDPPYGIGIKDLAWDGRAIHKAVHQGSERISASEAFERFTCAWASECLRLLPPGGYLVAFAAPRMVHRLVSGIENAGFEIRDQLLWLYGSGVPKSQRIPGGRGTALKPAYEAIILARRPLQQPLDATLATHGTGALNIEATSILDRDDTEGTVWRWPANLVVSHHDGCTPRRCHPDCPRALIDRQHDGDPPSRLFYCPKPSPAEREAGCEQLPAKSFQVFSSTSGGRPRRNIHPTVKPLALMRWLTRLVTPAGGLVLDPFTGSGTTGAAALLERRHFLGIEQEASYAAIARARISHWHDQAVTAAEERHAA